MTLQPVSNPAISELKMPFDPETQEPGIASCNFNPSRESRPRSSDVNYVMSDTTKVKVIRCKQSFLEIMYSK